MATRFVHCIKVNSGQAAVMGWHATVLLNWFKILGALVIVVAGSGCAGRSAVHPPGASAALPGVHEFLISVEDFDRHYRVHVPPGYDETAAIAVVIMLHGGGGTSKAAAYETGWGQKADAAGFIAVFPDALPPDRNKRSQFSRNPQLWNDGSDRFYSGQKVVDDVAFIDAMLDDLSARYKVDQKRIFVTGFSNGASMTFRLGAELSARIAAIAPVAGALWLESVTLARPVPMLYMTGTEDPLNLIEGGVPKLAGGGSDAVRAKPKPPVKASVQAWASAIGCDLADVHVSSVDGVHTEYYGSCRGRSEVKYIAVDGLGHTWAGGKSILPGFMVGKQSDKIHATDVIWAFFNKHPMT